MNNKMAEKTLVRDHVLKIFDHLNTLEILGGEIDIESQIDIILEWLFDSFNQFKLNCSMNKIDFILSKLLNTLHAANGIIKCHFSFSKEKGKQKKKKVLSNPNKILNPLWEIGKGNKVNDPKTKRKCFHYGIVGHWKSNCPNYLT